MSNIQRMDNIKQIVVGSRQGFESLAKIHGAVEFQREASFAMQALQDNDYLAGVALGNPDSLKRAVLNVAAVGLSLSPVYKYAYLVPRDKKIILDISYKGLIQLAINTGHIKLVTAELVCEKDVFKLNGIGKEPTHTFEPFKDRGEFIGVYCLVKTKDDEYITTIMNKEEVYKVRDTSQGYKSGKQTPWKSFESEMIKKTVIRRAYKMWPLPEKNNFEQAINVLNEEDPADFKDIKAIEENLENKIELIKTAQNHLSLLKKTEAEYLKHLNVSLNREIKALDDLTEIELKKEIIFLEQYLKQVKSENTASDT